MDEKYCLYIYDQSLAENVTLETALLLVESTFKKYKNDDQVIISIKRMENEEE